MTGGHVVIDNNESFVKSKEEFLRRKKILSKDQPYRWSTNLYYIINKGLDEKKIKEAFQRIENRSCFKFIKTMKIIKNTQGFIFNSSTFLGTFFGNVVKNGYQYIYLRKNDSFLSSRWIMHFILNALGMYHEHMRPDRGNFIRVNYENIDESALDDFQLLNASNVYSYGIDYDLGSLLHYGPIAYSKQRQPTIEARLPPYNKMIGQKEKLSFNDIKLLNIHYCYNMCPKKLSCYNSGYQNPIQCKFCNCPNGYTGRQCEKIFFNKDNCDKKELITKPTSQEIILKGAKSCTYAIYAPKDHIIKMRIKLVIFQQYRPCIERKGFEIKYRNDKGAMGLNLCEKYKDIYLKSEGNTVLIQYNGKRKQDKVVMTFKHASNV
uniref:Metalloendopeptidase n=1 Tax=Parastrongyloides trichosuri TaxID=131310 RepID=A0A0N4Z4N3_PARTI